MTGIVIITVLLGIGGFAGSILFLGLIVLLSKSVFLLDQFDEDKYSAALRLSCLNNELAKFSGKDSCIITDGGKNLSGGQAIRIQLARAIYQDSDIILLDDVLNSIDMENRSFLIQNLIKEFWNQKILVMVTNDQMLIDLADEHYCMENGSLIANKYLVLNKPLEVLQVNCSCLSKSERLSVALARVCLKNPDVLLLDESIANVDDDTWERIKLLMESRFAEKTVLSISHNNNDDNLYIRKIVLM